MWVSLIKSSTEEWKVRRYYDFIILHFIRCEIRTLISAEVKPQSGILVGTYLILKIVSDLPTYFIIWKMIGK